MECQGMREHRPHRGVDASLTSARTLVYGATAEGPMKRRKFMLMVPLAAALLGFGCEGGKEMKVTGINPPAGHIAGDQTVEIRGQNFRTDIGYTVYFGNAKAKSLTIRSTEALTVTSPSGQPGPVDVTVRADNGEAFLLKQAFRYEDMGGSVVEGLGKTGETKQKGNLAY
jgi:hypothetical protein